MTDEIFEKRHIITMLLLEPEALMNVYIKNFFDMDSNEMLDKKIEVLTKLKNGEYYHEIDGFYEILELYPPPKEWEVWD